MIRPLVALGMLAVLAVPAQAGGRKRSDGSCLKALGRLVVKWSSARRRGIAIGVRVRGPLGGITYEQYDGEPLIIDCSLAVSLAAAGPWLTALGFDRAIWSGAYHWRTIHFKNKRSKHSYGLAIDVHQYDGPGGVRFTVKDDYEQGLGDKIDCIGAPLTQGGLLLRTAECQMARSGMFRFILDPDYNAEHHHHFHIEVKPWAERTDDPIAIAARPQPAPPGPLP
ncbi:MAG TPA: extensin family protein [Kofleriaceae bacterium]|nr:extensin family protein [Kofleriaceae bacterium]